MFTQSTFAQNEKVTLKIKNGSVQSFIKAVEKQTPYTFVYRNNIFSSNAKVSIECKQQTLSSTLSRVFSPMNVGYSFNNNTIVLVKKAEETPSLAKSLQSGQPKSPVMQKVSGVVVDEKGEPVIGATITDLSNPSNKAVTDIDGNFVLNNVSKAGDISISYIGYSEKVVKATSEHLGNINLSESSQGLNEVVVIGYGTVKKADLASSIAIVDNKTFKDQPINNVADIFQGRAAGVQVENSSIPGGGVKIRVRGANSINRSNDPLYVVDGIVRESGLTGLNPEDIASMQILKDASSTAIYGSRGSNGVVLITTKMGKADQKIITFDAQLTTSSLAKRYKTLSPYDYATAYREIKNAKAFTEEEMESYKNGTAGIDWQDELFRTALTQNYKLAISNGNKDTQYYLSGNYMNQDGIIINTSNTRYQVRGNVTSNITKWLHLTADINGSRNQRKGIGFSAQKGNPIWVALNYSPTMVMQDETGKYNKDPYNSITSNPIGALNMNASENLEYIVNGKIDLRFTILPNLTFTTTNGIDYFDSKGYYFSSTKVNDTNSMSNGNNNRVLLQTTNNLTYRLESGNHNLTLTGVYEYTTSETRSMGMSGNNLLTESVGWWDINMATSYTLSNGYSQWKLMSGVGRAIYDYAHRYIFTGTLRADGSSKFSKKKWGYFPSVAFAWNIANEKFMAKQHTISDLKLRASYGVVGNQAINPYSTLGLMSQTIYSFGDTNNYTGYWSNALPTPDLTWEKTNQFDLGVDISLWGGRISASLDYFNKNSVDCLLQKQIPGYNGGGTYWINAGKINNKGLDFSLTANILQGKDLNWSSTLTATYLKNKVVSLGGDEFLYGSSPAHGLVDAVTIIKPGYPVGSFFGYTWLGIDENGDNKFLDSNENGVIDTGDRGIIGKSTPDVTMGWNNSVAYKRWTLNAFFTGAFGADKLNLVRFGMASMAGDTQFITLSDAYWKGFDKIGAGAIYPSLLSKTNKAQPGSTQWLESADYVRLENLSISYNLGKDITHFADIVLSLSAQNLFTLTGYKGYDPTSSAFSSDNVDIDGGIDIGAYPHPRSFTFGVKMNF